MRAALFLSALLVTLPLHADPTATTIIHNLGGTPGAPLVGTGNTFDILPGNGQLINNTNLFHSFQQFDLKAGDTADFHSGGATNIIARVNGGIPSNIFGNLVSDANLFFINPSGVFFGPNATINVTGAFTVSTANFVRLSDGGIFYADLGGSDHLTSAPVSAFGFTSPTPGAITFSGSQLSNTHGIHVIGGDLSFTSAQLLAAGSNLTLFSATSAGEVPFSLASPGTGFATATTTAFGNITATGSHLGIDGSTGGGSVVIRGGRLVADNSTITSLNSGSAAGGNISVHVDSLAMQNLARIGATAASTRASGSVKGGVVEHRRSRL